MFKRNFFGRNNTESRENLFNGSALIAIAFVLTLVLITSGCSGGHKYNPTDPVGSKNKQNQQGAPGTVTPSQTGDRTGVNSGGGSGPGNPDLSKTLEVLMAAGGGQSGPIFTNCLLAGVYDANTLEPIQNAVVSIGNNGQEYGTTDIHGVVEFTNLVLAQTPVTGDEESVVPNDLYITAGFDGYEMLSYSKITNQVVVFLLKPLVAPAVDKGEVYGTVDFGTDDFRGEIYATNFVEYTDSVLLPSGPGDEDDTYSIQVESGSPSIVIMVQRDTETNQIIRIYCQRAMPDSGGSSEISFEVPPDPLGSPAGDDLTGDRFDVPGWIDYHGTDLTGSLLVPIPGISFASLDAYLFLVSAEQGYLPVIDRMSWVESPDQLRRYYNTTCMPSLASGLNFTYMETWVRAIYENGSGSFQLIDLRTGHPETIEAQLYTPPYFTEPLDDSLGIGLTPILSWAEDENVKRFQKVITLTDTVNGNRWRIIVGQNSSTTMLPVLPEDMDDWGLTLGNQLHAIVVNDLPDTIFLGSDDHIEIQPIDDLDANCFSAVYDFTP